MSSFWLWTVCVNWGRGYQPGEFRDNVMRVIDKVGGRAHVVLLPQEVDEADPAPEHKVLAKALVPGTHRVGWGTHEPICVSPTMKVSRERVEVTMAAGLDLRPPAPKGTGPTRHAVTCIATDRETRIDVAFGNTHPHRNLPIPTVKRARAHGADVFREELQKARNATESGNVIYGLDANDLHFPQMLVGEKSAIHRGLDYIRYRGTGLDLQDTGTLNGTIDPHDPLWALFKVQE